MFDKIKGKFYKWLELNCCSDLNSEDEGITIEEAINNYNNYQKTIDEKVKNFIKQKCCEIENRSQRGGKRIFIYASDEDFLNRQRLIEVKKFFSKKGFKVTHHKNKDNDMYDYIMISWRD